MHEIQAISPALRRRKKRLTVLLLCIWLAVSFGPTFFARTLSFEIGGWPFHFWMAAQGAILVFFGINVIYAFLMNRWEAQEAAQASADPAHRKDSSRKKSV
jgi:putative solute:sodium symporter small subunit